MKITKSAAAVAATATVAAGLLLVGAPNASAAAPPYEPDPGSFGTLTFYDAGGNQITSGNINDKPFAAYTVGSNAGRAGDHTTLLNMAQPNPSTDISLWSRDTITGATDYPLTGGGDPANIVTLSQTHPVSKGTSGDLSINDFIGEFPNDPAHDSNTAYQNLYQFRLITANGADQNQQYEVADVLVSGTTWTQVFPTVANAPGAPTNVTASAGIASATVSWTAPADNGGASITGYDVQYSSNSGSTWTSAAASFHTSTATSHVITGLTAGTPYVFRVAAINATGTGAYSAQSLAVVPTPVHTTALAIGGPTSVGYGRSAIVTAKLTDATAGIVLKGAHVTLFRRAASNKPWVSVKTVTTSTAGTAAVTLTLTGNTQFQYRYAGDATHKASTSAIRSVAVAQLIAIHATPSTIRHGHTLQIWGTVAPAGAGQKVTLQRLFGRTWKSQGSVTIKRQKLPNGRTAVGYVFVVKLATKGTFKYRVTKAGTSTLAAGVSPIATVQAT